MLILHVSWTFPSEISRNRLWFSDQKQQLLEFEIDGGELVDVDDEVVVIEMFLIAI